MQLADPIPHTWWITGSLLILFLLLFITENYAFKHALTVSVATESEVLWFIVSTSVIQCTE